MQTFRRLKKLWLTLFFIYKCIDYLHNHNNLIRLRAHIHRYGYINSLNIYLQKSTKEMERVLAHRSRRLTGDLIV